MGNKFEEMLQRKQTSLSSVVIDLPKKCFLWGTPAKLSLMLKLQ